MFPSTNQLILQYLQHQSLAVWLKRVGEMVKWSYDFPGERCLLLRRSPYLQITTQTEDPWNCLGVFFADCGTWDRIPYRYG
jgi:hypothetical protein